MPEAKYLQGTADRGEPFPEPDFDLDPFLLPLPRPFDGLRPRLGPLLRGLELWVWAYLQLGLLQRPVFWKS